MARDVRPARLGATARPDVDAQQLATWEGGRLAAGFEIEDARIDATSDLAGIEATRGRVVHSSLSGVRLAGSRLRSLTMIDVLAAGIDASNCDWTGARLRRVVFEDCRMTGLQAAELAADDVVFRNCRLDLANFRQAAIRHTTFEGCVLDEADFAGASLVDSRCTDSRLRATALHDTRLSRVDLRRSELAPAGDVLALRGAIVDSGQLVGLAPQIAQAVGIVVDDG